MALTLEAITFWQTGLLENFLKGGSQKGISFKSTKGVDLQRLQLRPLTTTDHDNIEQNPCSNDHVHMYFIYHCKNL